MKRLRARAPGKVNLSLLVGGARADERHEVVTVLESVSLCDELELTVLRRRRRRRRGRVSRGGGTESGHRCPGRAALAWLGRAARADRDRQADPRGRRDGGRFVGRRGGAAAGGGGSPGGRRGDRRGRGGAWIRRSQPARSRGVDRDRGRGVGRGGAAARAARVRGRAAAVRAVDRGRVPRGRPARRAANRRRAVVFAARPCERC